MSSALVCFVDSIPRVTLPKVASPPPINPSSSANGMSLEFIARQISLGNFINEIEFDNQEFLVDAVLQSCAFYGVDIPKTYKQAMRAEDKAAWANAVSEELSNLLQMDVWVSKPMPAGVKPLDGWWVFAKKSGDDGTTKRYKARYVAKGFRQIAGKDFNKTFAPTATFVSLRLLLTIAARFNWPVHSFDFVAAYLNSPIDEEVWVAPPEGVDLPEGHAFLLKKALYGTRQAARCWWLHLRAILVKLGYLPSQYDNSLYILRHESTTGVIWIHVDDGVVTASSTELLKRLETDLKDILKIKWSEQLDSIVGLSIQRVPEGFILSQPKLIRSLLEEEWDGVLMAKTPLPPNFNAPTEDGDPTTSSKYLHILGILSYLAVGTRPDISFSVNYLARYSAKPSVLHWKGVRHLVNYIAGSTDQRLCLFPNKDPKALTTYCDASWGGEFSRSSYGVLIHFLGCPILWVARRQTTVAASTCHAEYMALGAATRHTLWIRHLLKDILKTDFVGHLHCDNQSAVRVGTDDASNKCTRHTDRDFYITNEALYRKLITLSWIPTAEQQADVFTKSLPPEQFKKMRSFLLSHG